MFYYQVFIHGIDVKLFAIFYLRTVSSSDLICQTTIITHRKYNTESNTVLFLIINQHVVIHVQQSLQQAFQEEYPI